MASIERRQDQARAEFVTESKHGRREDKPRNGLGVPKAAPAPPPKPKLRPTTRADATVLAQAFRKRRQSGTTGSYRGIALGHEALTQSHRRAVRALQMFGPYGSLFGQNSKSGLGGNNSLGGAGGSGGLTLGR